MSGEGEEMNHYDCLGSPTGRHVFEMGAIVGGEETVVGGCVYCSAVTERNAVGQLPEYFSKAQASGGEAKRRRKVLPGSLTW